MIGRKILDKYEVVRLIGNGGMGSVYEAIDVPTGHHVALKWMHAQEFAADDPNLVRFTQEARIAGRLDSPHVVTVYDLARDPDTNVPFHVMELLDGESLQSLVARVGPLNPDAALRIAAQACAGLAAAHAAGVVHRDIKPDNIFLSHSDGEIVVKVLDFGIAKIRPDNPMAASMTVPAAPMTKTGQVMGTPLYMAPEQIKGAKHVDARCDVYAMGVTLYAMLAGLPPHTNIKSVAQLLYTLSNAPTIPLLQAAPWVDPQLAAIVDKARSKDLDNRYPDASALLAALSALLPEGTTLREEMLVGIPDQQRQIVPIDANTDVNAKTAAPGVYSPETMAPTLVDAPTPSAAAPQSKPKWIVPVVIAVVITLAAIAAVAMR